MVSRYRELTRSGEVWHRYWQISWRCAPQFQCVSPVGGETVSRLGDSVQCASQASGSVVASLQLTRPDFDCHQSTEHVSSCCMAVRLLRVSNIPELRHTSSMQLYCRKVLGAQLGFWYGDFGSQCSKFNLLTF